MSKVKVRFKSWQNDPSFIKQSNEIIYKSLWKLKDWWRFCIISKDTTLKNLNKVFDLPAVQKVIENLSEMATLEGTKKTSVVTPIRREARSFSSSSSSTSNNVATALPLSYLPFFYGNNPNSDATIIGGTLSIYDPELRDIYHLSQGNTLAMGISSIYEPFVYTNIIRDLDWIEYKSAFLMYFTVERKAGVSFYQASYPSTGVLHNNSIKKWQVITPHTFL